MSVVSVKYYDEGTKQWELRRPTTTQQNISSAKQFKVCVVSLSQGSDVAAMEEVVVTTEPTFIAVLDVTGAMFDNFLQLGWVRAVYGVVDRSVANNDRGSMFLVRHGINVDFAASIVRAVGFPTTVLHMRQFQGMPCNIACSLIDPELSAAAHLQAVKKVLKEIDPAEVVIVASNFFKPPEITRQTLAAIRDEYQFSECMEDSWDANFGVFMKGSKATFSGAKVAAAGSLIVGVCTFTSKGIAIPQPRSALTKKDSPLSPPSMPPDPAIVAMADDKDGRKDSQRRARWRMDHAMQLKQAFIKSLSPEEAAYDLTAKFTSVRSTLDALNNPNVFQWTGEYAISHSYLVSSDSQICDVKHFRRYVAQCPRPRATAVSKGATPSAVAALLGKLTPPPEVGAHKDTIVPAAAATITNPVVALHATAEGDSASGKKVQEKHLQPQAPVVHQARGYAQAVIQNRPRVWSESCATILYQVTPREMVFDITPHLGVKSSGLKTAVARLNRIDLDAAEKDPLAEWANDYALLYCAEKQGYWLLAATDVPCDVIACRTAAAANLA